MARALTREEWEELLATQAALGRQLAPVPSEEQSLSDRLRPPYRTPLASAEPATAGASRILEVGYGRLPPAYQQALQAAPGRVRVGMMPPDDPDLRGIRAAFGPGGFQDPPTILAESPRTMTHELVHELTSRWGEPYDRAIDEALAQMIGGEEGSPSRPYTRGRAREIDAQIRGGQTPPPQPLMTQGRDAVERVLSELEYRQHVLPAWVPRWR